MARFRSDATLAAKHLDADGNLFIGPIKSYIVEAKIIIPVPPE
jgi:hypothetical protein